MADLTNSAGPKNGGAKPRLSLITSKQSTRLKSEDSPPYETKHHREGLSQVAVATAEEDDSKLTETDNINNKSQPHTTTATPNEADKEESLTLLNTLLELLDRHPLLALPRDSLYCSDYTCNELSTKNYLNLKIQHLESLIDQHRRFRYFIGERLKRSEQRYLELTLKLEYEKNLRIERERSAYRNGGKTLLLNNIDQIREALEKEKAGKHAIVMTLLNELLDERERNEKLSQRVLDLEGKLDGTSKTTPATSTKTTEISTPSKSMPAPVEHQLSSPDGRTICKPRVPAKPAQLLDRQRSQTSNR